MANPNMGAASNIYGGCTFDADIAVTASAIISNAASSGLIVKVNSLIISNIDGTNDADITVTVRNTAGSTTYSHLAKTISVPADATLVVISKDTSIYILEDRAIYLSASVAGDLSATCSYEVID